MFQTGLCLNVMLDENIFVYVLHTYTPKRIMTSEIGLNSLFIKQWITHAINT